MVLKDEQRGPARFLIKSFLTVVLLAVAFFIGRVGLADFLRLEPTTYIDQLNQGKARLSMERLARSRERLLLVRHIDAKNPIIPEYLAQVSYIRAGYSGFDKELQRNYLHDALREYGLALELRPNSGYLWAGKMTVMHLLATLQDKTVASVTSDPQWEQMMAAMKHAIQLAPWERGVLRQILVVGSKYYPVLGDEERQLFDSAKRNAVLLGLEVG